MKFYDATYGQGICQEIDRLCDTTDTTYPRKDKTARVNQALETVVSWIITSDGTWEFDDKNFSTIPVGTGTLTEGVAQISFASDYLDIIKVEVKDTQGYWHSVKPLDPKELGGLSWDEYFGANSDGTPKTGFPTHYNKFADGIILGPAPTSTSVTLTNGIRVTFQRTGSLFTVATDTSADNTEPGFASPFHVLLAYMAAIPYCMTYKKDRVGVYLAHVGDTEPRPTGMKAALLKHYARRERDEVSQATMAPIPGGFR